MSFNEYADQEMMMIELAQRLTGELAEHLMVNGKASFAVPGGTTPGPVFDALSAADLDWSKVNIMLTDERRVPAGHERSNERLLRERLLVNRAAEANYINIAPQDGSDLEGLIDDHLPLSVLLLGMGADMHTASLFPNSPDLEAAMAKDAPPLMYVDAPDGLEPRVTLTGPTLAGAMSTHVLITGAAKRGAIAAAQSVDPHEAPIKTVLGTAQVHWAP